MAVMVLGQSAPSATTNTTLYTVPSGKESVVSTLSVCNRGIAEVTYRVAVRPAGATLANSHYLVYDMTIEGNDSHFLTIGITLEATDVVTVYASSADLSFSAFGDET